MPSQLVQRNLCDGFELTLGHLIGSLSRDEFVESHWEQNAVVMQTENLDNFRSLFSIEDIDHWINSTRPRPGRLDLVSPHGFVRDNFLHPDSTANLNLVYDNYLKGSTLVLSGLEDTWAPLVRAARTLERDLSHPVAFAVYLTPPNTAGVQPHFDTQENFIVQIEGTKKWRVYDNTSDLPAVEGSYLPIPRERLGPLTLETELKPGQVLYIPRGFAHEAQATEQASLHITVDVHVRTWQDFLSDALASHCERNRNYRKALPIGFLTPDGHDDMLDHTFEQLVEGFSKKVEIDDAVRKHAQSLIVRRPPPADGRFALAFAETKIDTVLVKRSPGLTRVIREPDRSGLQFSGDQLLGPKKLEQAFAYIATHNQICPSDLPDLSPKEQVILCNRLVRAGLFTHRDRSTPESPNQPKKTQAPVSR